MIPKANDATMNPIQSSNVITAILGMLPVATLNTAKLDVNQR